MKFQSLAHLRVARLLLLLNLAFWLIFAILFLVKSSPYKPHKPVFEERSPEFIYFGRALSVLENEQISPLMKTTLAVQKPSFYAARPFFWYFNSRGITVDQQYRGISVGGYYLLLVCLVSFLQWFLVGWVLQKLSHKWSSHPAAAPNQTPSTPATR
jgi:hypothetical protein